MVRIVLAGIIGAVLAYVLQPVVKSFQPTTADNLLQSMVVAAVLFALVAAAVLTFKRERATR